MCSHSGRAASWPAPRPRSLSPCWQSARGGGSPSLARACRVTGSGPCGSGSASACAPGPGMPLDLSAGGGGAGSPRSAARRGRADAFAHAVSQKGVEDATFWAGKASDYLRAFFHAAALAGGDMRLVTGWVLSHDTAGAEEVLHRHGSDEWAAQLAQLRGQAAKTAETIRMTMSRALAFMGDPVLAASVLPHEGQGLDIGEFLAANGTLYLVAEAAEGGGEAPVAPLFACMAAEIRYTAALAGSV